MIATAKLFQNGQSQAVRLPKAFRFENATEVFIKKVDGVVMLIPKTDEAVWSRMFERLSEFSDDYLNERTQPGQKREEIF